MPAFVSDCVGRGSPSVNIEHVAYVKTSSIDADVVDCFDPEGDRIGSIYEDELPTHSPAVIPDNAPGRTLVVGFWCDTPERVPVIGWLVRNGAGCPVIAGGLPSVWCIEETVCGVTSWIFPSEYPNHRRRFESLDSAVAYARDRIREQERLERASMERHLAPVEVRRG